MTYPRAHLIDTTQPGFYHIVSRCVRSSFLCGTDPLTGRSFEHRRAWIESRLQQLASLFSLDVYAYAVMRNHYHIVVRLEPRGPEAWSASEVAARWIDINLPGTHDSSNAAVASSRYLKPFIYILSLVGKTSMNAKSPEPSNGDRQLPPSITRAKYGDREHC